LESEPREVDVMAGEWTLHFGVPKGASEISFEPLDVPDVKAQPNGDSRPLILGVERMEVTAAPPRDTCVVPTPAVRAAR